MDFSFNDNSQFPSVLSAKSERKLRDPPVSSDDFSCVDVGASLLLPKFRTSWRPFIDRREDTETESWCISVVQHVSSQIESQAQLHGGYLLFLAIGVSWISV